MSPRAAIPEWARTGVRSTEVAEYPRPATQAGAALAIPDAMASELQALLVLAEGHCTELSDALLQGQPDAVERAARELQQAALALSGLLQSRQKKPGQSSQANVAPPLCLTPGGGNVEGISWGCSQVRLSRIAQTLAMQREALLRRSAVVERALHSIVPATQASTYAGSAAPYGRNARQTGAFKFLSA